VQAVDGVSFHVDAGEVLAIVGESGCGKSVTGMTLLGLTRSPNTTFHGSARYDGQELLTASEHELESIRGAEIAMVFQDPMTGLNPVQRIGPQIVEQIRAHEDVEKDAALERARALPERVGIPRPAERLRAYPHELSGGMRQRVMIAMALSCNPRLLIADEPTTALDVTIQAQIIELIRELRERVGMSIIWITHDLGVVAGLADTVQVMYAGRIVERGPVDAVFEDPRSAYTLGLLRSLPDVRGGAGKRLYQIEGSPPDLREPPRGDPFAPRNPYATPRDFVEAPPLAQVPEGAPGHLAAAWYDLREARAREARA